VGLVAVEIGIGIVAEIEVEIEVAVGIEVGVMMMCGVEHGVVVVEDEIEIEIEHSNPDSGSGSDAIEDADWSDYGVGAAAVRDVAGIEKRQHSYSGATLHCLTSSRLRAGGAGVERCFGVVVGILIWVFAAR